MVGPSPSTSREIVLPGTNSPDYSNFVSSVEELMVPLPGCKEETEPGYGWMRIDKYSYWVFGLHSSKCKAPYSEIRTALGILFGTTYSNFLVEYNKELHQVVAKVHIASPLPNLLQVIEPRKAKYPNGMPPHELPNFFLSHCPSNMVICLIATPNTSLSVLKRCVTHFCPWAKESFVKASTLYLS